MDMKNLYTIILFLSISLVACSIREQVGGKNNMLISPV